VVRRQAPRILPASEPTLSPFRRFSHSPLRLSKDLPKESQRYNAVSTSAKPGEIGNHEGEHARINESIQVEYPKEEDIPHSRPVQGRGGPHLKRTLASFSLEGRVAVVTGGARGLGLVMAQALVTSGADVALVDLNRDEAHSSAQQLIESYKSENPGAEKCGDPPSSRSMLTNC
jgi:hypothetical protein